MLLLLLLDFYLLLLPMFFFSFSLNGIWFMFIDIFLTAGKLFVVGVAWIDRLISFSRRCTMAFNINWMKILAFRNVSDL